MRTGWVVVRRLLLGRDLHTETSPRGVKVSVFVRHLSGGSSGLVEAELEALTSPVYDLGQYGIHFVSSPRHADLLLMTGPLTRNMLGPAQQAFAVMCEPKGIVTVGDSADFAGRCPPSDPIARRLLQLYEDSYATVSLPEQMRAAIVAHVPGDPPAPAEIIEVLLDLFTRTGRAGTTGRAGGPAGKSEGRAAPRRADHSGG